MIREGIAPGEYFHIFNRGNDKQNILKDARDYIRFLFLILYFQSPLLIYNLGRQVTYFVRHRMFNMQDEEGEILKSRYVELVAFCLMPNHFHLLVKQHTESGISKYMQKVQNAYTKYFNTKYKRTGHLFQGPYKIVHVATNNQLLYLSCYIHRNPRELLNWKDKEDKYPWSSLQDYTSGNRWGFLLEESVVIEQFSGAEEYAKFVGTSTAKELSKIDDLLIDC